MNEHERWWQDAGQYFLIKDIELEPHDTAMDVGGYKGDFTALLRREFDCFVRSYEPLPAFYKEMESRFAGDKKVQVLRWGLADRNYHAQIAVMADATSLHYPLRSNAPTVELRDITLDTGFFGGLLALNAEGSEYDILDRLGMTDSLKFFRQVLVQFHDFVPEGATRRERCRHLLAQNHREVWCYPYVWELWKLK